jgi:hypothetical protein
MLTLTAQPRTIKTAAVAPRTLPTESVVAVRPAVAPRAGFWTTLLRALSAFAA